MRKTITALLLIISLPSFSTVWRVGPGRTYTSPSQVAALVSAGDTIEIDAAVYLGDVCSWNANNLLIKGVGGRPHLRANGNYAQGKGIWVFAGNNITVENMEFSEAAVPDQNGAGIRLDGMGIYVKNCYFHHNENGILTANNGGTVRIDNSEFGYNGFGDGFSHNIYIGRVDSAIVRFSYFHHANVGHEFKSRARVNYITCNRFSNEAAGNASREIDLPNGGVSILISNIIQQGANSENGNIVGYGLEGLVNAAPHVLYLIQNSFVNERSAGSFISANAGTSLLKVYNNIFAGPGSTLLYSGTAVPDIASNITTIDISSLHFINAAAYDYHIGSNSPALNAGTAAGTAINGESLQAVFEYQHPAAAIPRTNNGTADAGAYEAAAVVPVYFKSFNGTYNNDLVKLYWETENETNIAHYDVMKITPANNVEKIGTVTARGGTANQYEMSSRAFTANSRYQIKAVHTNGAVTYSKIIELNTTENDQQPFAIFTRGNIMLFRIPKEMQEGKTHLSIYSTAAALLFKEERKLGETAVIERAGSMLHNGALLCIILQNGNSRIVVPVKRE